MLALDPKDTRVNRLETRTGIGAYRRGETGVVSVVHQFVEGMSWLMTSRVASASIETGPKGHACDDFDLKLTINFHVLFFRLSWI